MDSIEQMLHYMEDGTVEEGSNCVDLFAAIDKLRDNPNNYISTYIALKQFVRHQLTRGNFVPPTSTADEGITITINGE